MTTLVKGPGSPAAMGSSEEVQNLRRQLKVLLSQARHNEEKLRRYQELELRLIGCTALYELLRLVVYEFRIARGLDKVSLLLFDPEYEMRRILEEEGINLAEHPDFLFTEQAEIVSQLYGLSATPQLGPYKAPLHGQLFSAKGRAPESVAVLPMVRRGQLIGSLNLGSFQGERFVAGTASDFLERLAMIVAVCLENVTNHERLKRVGLTDVLTAVNNRRFFDQRLVEEATLARRSARPLSCLFLDVDHFKRINDNHGHQVGDLVLREIAGLIRVNLRASDVLARYGGEEFSALLIQTGLQEAREIAERIRHSIEHKIFELRDGRQLNVTISIGVATTEELDMQRGPAELGAALVELSDARVFQAKSSGRNQVRCA